MRQKEVIIATLMRPQGDTGVQTHFNAVCEYLRRQDVTVSMVTPLLGPKALIYPLFGLRWFIDRVSGTASVWWYEYWHYRVLRYLLRRKLILGPAVVYAQCPLSARAALEARVAPEQKVIMVVHFNVSQADEWVSKGKIRSGDNLYRAIQRREQDTLPRLDGIVFVSDFVRGEVYRRIPDAKRVPAVVISNFIRRADPQDPCSPRNDLINIGTLEPRKNQQFLLKVLAETKRLGKQYRLSLVGDGPDRSKLKKLAHRLGIADQVSFLGRHPQAAKQLALHRAYCHSATMETQGIALIEALSYGVPILAAPVGGIPEVFRDGIEGYYWNLDQPSESARKMVQLLEDPERLHTMSLAARRRFETQFEEAAVGARLLSFLTGNEHGSSPCR